MAVKRERLLQIFVTVLLFPCNVEPVKDPVLVCYFTSWAPLRPIPVARMFAKDIEPHLCTHLILAFANIHVKTKSLEPSSPFHDLSTNLKLGTYRQFTQLKIANPKLFTMISIGGATAKPWIFREISQSRSSRVIFADNVVKFLNKHNFDGLDVDWEFPSSEDGTNKTFTLLLNSLMAAFFKEQRKTGLRRHVLSVAVSAGAHQIDASYEVEKISNTVDFINLMTYDYAGPWNKIAALNSPLYPRQDDLRFNQNLCVEYSVNYWIDKGADRNKIVLGIATNGKSFTLGDRTVTGVGANVTAMGVSGRYLGIRGNLGYLEICKLLEVQAIDEWDDQQKVPYAHWGTQWVGYENMRSVAIKTEWMLNQSLAGVMIWTLDFDDFNGKFCNDTAFPLVSTIKEKLDAFKMSFTTLQTTPYSTNVTLSTRPSIVFTSTSTRPYIVFTSTIDTTSNSTRSYCHTFYIYISLLILICLSYKKHY